MNNTTLEKIISETQSSPYIKWNDESLADLIRYDNVYNVFIFNKDGNPNLLGYLVNSILFGALYYFISTSVNNIIKY